jgi:FlaA1/EpsC-like NDP-sugar epimerase
VIPLFHEQITSGGPVTITTPEMTRFLMSLNQAVDTIFAALLHANRGETFVPRIPAARVVDIAQALIGDRPIKVEVIGVRPGEKIHEILVSEEEASRTMQRGDYYAIAPMLPQLQTETDDLPFEGGEYSSAASVMSLGQVDELLRAHGLLIDDTPVFLDDVLAAS